MLGRIYSSVEHFYVPRLIHLEEKGVVGVKAGDKGKSYNLYRLDWTKSDAFKRDTYQKWAADHCQHQTKLSPSTLPEPYDTFVRNFVFALPTGYLEEIQHFAQFYFMERMRVRKFDTCIRDMCLKPSQAAINCSVKLLADCIYDQDRQTWFRENEYMDKHVAKCLMMYKFWREATGRGLVWEHAELDNLERSATHMESDKHYASTNKLILMYRRVLGDIRRFEEEQEMLWTFMNDPAMPNGQALDLFYSTQEVHGEEAVVRSKEINAQLVHLPFLPGTLRVSVFDEDGKILLSATYDAAGVPDTVIGQDDELGLVVDTERSTVSEDGKMHLCLKSGRFPAGATARLFYDYTLLSGEGKQTLPA